MTDDNTSDVYHAKLMYRDISSILLFTQVVHTFLSFFLRGGRNPFGLVRRRWSIITHLKLPFCLLSFHLRPLPLAPPPPVRHAPRPRHSSAPRRGSLEPARRRRPPSDLVFCRPGSVPPPKARPAARRTAGPTQKLRAERGAGRAPCRPPPSPRPSLRAGAAGRAPGGRQCRVTEGRRRPRCGLQCRPRGAGRLCNDNGTRRVRDLRA